MKLKPSLRAFKAFCRLFPDNERGWYMMAQVARNMDDVEVLVSASRRLFQLNPNHGEGYGQLGDALSDMKYYLPAISTLRKALEIRRREPVPFHSKSINLAIWHLLTILFLQGFEFDIFVEANYKLVLSWTCSWDEVEYVDKDLLEHLDAAISRSLSLPAPAHMLFNMKIPRELYRDWVDAWYQSCVNLYILWLIHV
jgi:tetratricopeptide (TPR) repeat protein